MQRKETSAEGVRKFQKQPGFPVKSFPDLGLYEIEKDTDSNVANDDTDDTRTELSELL
ncbi:MAG: hypothetical protein WBE34_11425 [Candidatus Nitrosopolaris sp.]